MKTPCMAVQQWLVAYLSANADVIDAVGGAENVCIADDPLVATDGLFISVSEGSRLNRTAESVEINLSVQASDTQGGAIVGDVNADKVCAAVIKALQFNPGESNSFSVSPALYGIRIANLGRTAHKHPERRGPGSLAWDAVLTYSATVTVAGDIANGIAS